MANLAQSISRADRRIEDPYDHPIKLVDATNPQAAESDSEPGSRSSSKAPGLVKQFTGVSVREELAKRKYAKWQQGRFDDKEVATAEQQATGQHSDSAQALAGATGGNHIQGTDFAPSTSQEHSREHSRVRGRSKERKDKLEEPVKSDKEVHEIDILYENQRGWFFFGIPLYSHRSLLNLDPSPWVTREFKDSAVNITNAQVPDPSWQWSWKSWYVDMSYDVDEEGWQYSFSFSNRTSWHGVHPWFHSFVRRRRWLRKRVKRHHFTRGKAGDMHQAHMLTSDYFTIHAFRREPSPGSTTGRESHISKISTLREEEPVEEDIRNIPALTKALRRATVDREKVNAVKNFVQNGGDELYYLEEQIPNIMSQFVFQNSRRQLLSCLLHTVENATNTPIASGKKPETDPAASRRIDNLSKALHAAEQQAKTLEYWSDVQNVEKQELDSSEETEAFRSGILGARHDPQHEGDDGGDVAGDIRGISRSAEADVDRTRVALSPPSSNADAVHTLEGETKEKNNELSEEKDSGQGAGESGEGTTD